VIRDLAKDFDINVDGTYRGSAGYPSTPLDPYSQIEDLPPPTEEDKRLKPWVHSQYRSIVGSLMYLMVGTRPDIGYAVSTLSRHLSNPSALHLSAAKRVVRYLLGTIDHSIVYRTSDEPYKIEAFVDADWAGCKLTRRSQSGGVVLAAGGPIHWFSAKQPLVTLSSAEAELTALTNIVKDVLWLRRVVTDIVGIPPNGPTDIYCDNSAAIQIAYESSTKRKTKHTQIYYHFVKDELDAKSIAVHHVVTTYNKADILTKNMIAGTFTRLRDYLLIAVAEDN
jgi:hypothetical protein